MEFSNNRSTGVPTAGPSYAGSSPNGARRVNSSSEALPPFLADKPNFDVFTWHQAYVSCQRYFLDHSQHDTMVQAVAALVNIRLPFQWAQNPVMGSNRFTPPGAAPAGSYTSPYGRHGMSPVGGQPIPAWVSLVPYIRRLVATGFDSVGIMHGFFGDDWIRGVGDLQECERRNFLFTAKSVGWAKVKYQYDMTPDELIPFIRPLQNAKDEEIENAEMEWSKWLAMEDWMLGPRDPDVTLAAAPETRGSSA